MCSLFTGAANAESTKWIKLNNYVETMWNEVDMA
jgi:hypothetical protein